MQNLSYIPLKEKLIFYKKCTKILVKSRYLRVMAFVTFCSFSLYTIKRKRNIFKIYAYTLVKSRVIEIFYFWTKISFSTNSILMTKWNYVGSSHIIRFQKLLWGIFFDDFILSTILGKSQFVRKPLKTLGKSRVLFFGTNRTNQKSILSPYYGRKQSPSNHCK